MLPSAKGQYQARPMKWKVGKSSGGAVELAIDFALFGWWDGTQWIECDCEIQGYFYLTNKEGKINERSVETVEDVLGWNRSDGLNWFLNATNLPDCQLALDYEDYKGQQKIKVKWLNAFDRDPNSGLGDSDPTEVKALDAQFGSVFRATARKPVTAKPAAPARPAPTNPAQAEMSIAWAAFQKAFPELSKEAVAIEWKQAINEFKPTPPKTWLAADWTRFVADNFIKVVENPIEDDAVFVPDDIPF